MSEEKKFIEKVIAVQEKLKAPKGQYNKFGKYNYRSAEDILTAVKPLNADEGLHLTLSDEPVLIGERYYIKATAQLTDGIEKTVVTAYARESQSKKGMDDSQITGTASSYARKYALNGLYLIDDTKDADTDEFKHQQDKAKPITKKQQDELTKNFETIAQIKNVSQQTVENQMLACVEYQGLLKDIDENIYLKIKTLSERNIEKLQKEK